MTDVKRNGFVGASGAMLAIRPIVAGLAPAIRQVVSVRWERESKEWLIKPAERLGVSQLARDLHLTVLPEARVLVGLSPGDPILTPEPVPSTAWGSNVRNHVAPEVWKELRTDAAKRAGKRCEICGRIGPQWPTECNEKWSYDDTNAVQSLEKLEALCPTCHHCYHIGRAQAHGQIEEVHAHLRLVNGWTQEQVDAMHEDAMDVWRVRSDHLWHLDLDKLTDYGVEPPRTQTPYQRAIEAQVKFPAVSSEANDPQLDTDDVWLEDFIVSAQSNVVSPEPAFRSVTVPAKQNSGIFNRIFRCR